MNFDSQHVRFLFENESPRYRIECNSSSQQKKFLEAFSSEGFQVKDGPGRSGVSYVFIYGFPILQDIVGVLKKLKLKADDIASRIQILTPGRGFQTHELESAMTHHFGAWSYDEMVARNREKSSF